MSQSGRKRLIIDPIEAHEQFKAGGAKGRSLTAFATDTPVALEPGQETTMSPARQEPPMKRRKGNPQKGSRSDKAGWQQQTLVLPPELRKWLKHYAVDHDAEMSDIAAQALEEYRQRHKSK